MGARLWFWLPAEWKGFNLSLENCLEFILHHEKFVMEINQPEGSIVERGLEINQ